ncbi:MAG: alkaline phosphatase [Ignavibacteriales bacterium]|nr:MAG: alkaline phosphatase [Ignavibacteriales bacterium]
MFRIRSVLIFILLLITLAFGTENKRPINIILLIGDGMGLNYVAASYNTLLNDPYKRFEVVGLSNTCAADKLITDSAAGATAIATGYKTKNKFISLDDHKKQIETILHAAKDKNYKTGIVVTSSVTNATPAAFYAHVDDRYLENEIAKQLTEFDIDVVIGGGERFFLPRIDGGKRDDHLNLINKIKENGYKYFNDIELFKNTNPGNKYYALLGDESLSKASERNYSLGDLTKIAINSLKNDDSGFFLMIEGSQIDWEGHDNKPEGVIDELKDFNAAIHAALDFAEEDGNTLVIVTADHETGGLTITGGSKEEHKVQLDFISKDHTGGFVPVFAFGPSATLFSGVYENNEIGRKIIRLVNPSHQF